jgi:pSer/pThr/pTyr-binding forkhead associated (FHA) protein
MEVKLIVTQGKQTGQEVPVPGPKFFVGRAEDCQLRPHSDLISRHHCVILIEEGYAALRDFGSKNGTYVNGQRVEDEVELKSGDRLRFGQLEFEVRLNVGVGGKKLPKVHSVQEAAVRTAEKARPKKDAKEEMDVSDWLEDDFGARLSDTTTMDPTQQIGLGKSPAAAESDESDANGEVEEESAEDQDAKKQAARPSLTPKSSHDAASQALKNLLRRF